MSYGLEIYNQQGTLILSTKNRLYRFIGQYFFAASGGDEQILNVTVPGIVDDGTWVISPIGEKGYVQIFTGYVTVYLGFRYDPTFNFFNVFRT